VYALLREALKASGKIGVANVVLHNKQHLAALIPVGPVLALNTLRWSEEVRDFNELKLPSEDPKKAGVTARELDMAKKLIDDMSDSWNPSTYHDTFRDDIMTLVDRKIRAGKTEAITDVETPRESRQSAEILDLSDLLKRSLGRGKNKAGGRSQAVQDDDDPEEPATPRRRKTATAKRANGANGTRGAGARSAATRKDAPARKRSAA
jgi:DNA end-binding protein Ku